MTGFSSLAALSLFVLVGCSASVPLPSPMPGKPRPIREPLPHFVLEGQPYCFVGTNNYYLSYKSRESALAVLESASAMGATVVRTWAFLDRGSLDESVRSTDPPGHKDGVYFQYWDPEENRPAYNDGELGLQRLDFVVHEARRLGLKLILPFTNNWPEFGGMKQMLAWYGETAHHRFYTEPRVKEAYRAWVHHLVTRRNSIDGVLYSEDPAIFAWELANEPRAASDALDRLAGGYSDSTVLEWAREMSGYVKSLDRNHMVSVGDEGFLRGDGHHFTYGAPDGVDHEALTALESIDFGTFHLYPDHWGTRDDFGVEWIEAHSRIAERLDKPEVLEEFGLVVARSEAAGGPVVSGLEARLRSYREWTSVAETRGIAGVVFWHLVGTDGSKGLYPDYDHFSVYPGDATFELLSRAAARYPSAAVACKNASPSGHSPLSFVRPQGVRASRFPAPGSSSN